MSDGTSWMTILTYAGLAAGGLILFIIVHKIVRFVFSVLITLALVLLAFYLCMRAGLLPRETTEKISGALGAQVEKTTSEIGNWAEGKVREKIRDSLSDE